MAGKKLFEVEMSHAKDTKNTLMYESDSRDAPIPTLYISKSAADGARKIKVTVEVVE